MAIRCHATNVLGVDRRRDNLFHLVLHHPKLSLLPNSLQELNRPEPCRKYRPGVNRMGSAKRDRQLAVNEAAPRILGFWPSLVAPDHSQAGELAR